MAATAGPFEIAEPAFCSSNVTPASILLTTIATRLIAYHLAPLMSLNGAPLKSLMATLPAALAVG